MRRDVRSKAWPPPSRNDICGGAKPHPYLRSSCGQPLVLVMKTTQHGSSNDPAHPRRAGPGRGPGRSFEIQGAVRPSCVVVGHVLAQHTAKVALVENDEVIEALSAEGADDPFGDGVRFGSSDRSENGFDAQPSCPGGEAPAIAAVAVPDEVFGRWPQGVASMTCRHTHSAVGWAVTFK